MIIDCIADLHGYYPELEGGDLLIVCGDLTARDTVKQNEDFRQWIKEQNYKKKIVIAGNHDNLAQLGFYDYTQSNQLYDFEYLCDSGTTFRDWPLLKPGMEDGTKLEAKDYKIWGIPWSKRFIGMNTHCMAFTYCDEARFYDEKLTKIPTDIDILITHAPPYGILDKTVDGESVGSTALYNWLNYVGRPRLHVFGHIHEGYGEMIYKRPGYGYENNTICINASHVNERYQPVNKPVRVIL